ncbi:hypothetical protein GCM10007205_01340 [Oxalicibacterium flavum]|uniref:Uncharacterized protein n=1 Tax=Oxalicibacterium flavum TaxID=179467 RepID=A0A8J2UM58_9BURK|nr:N-acetyltransferase [Oxalicibacterium flavum]GGB95815.1 hypothetical protein GCM10007205_01340 [Oxalicibacterium flavum]
MHALSAPFPFFSFALRPLALRIDVLLPPAEVERELEMLYRRLKRPGDLLYDLPTIEIDAPFPGLVFRYRESDGEYYVYAEDTLRGRLAGYTVFKRMVELNRRQDRYLRSTHSKYATAYQRRGIASAVYRWWLDAGRCLISGARQSAGAHALWRKLGNSYGLIFVDLREKRLRHLGNDVSERVFGELQTRMILTGATWDVARLCKMVEMETGPMEELVEARAMRRLG